jgi:adenylate cyclase
MQPESIPHFSIGPLFGLAANGVMSILCLVTSALYHHYRPLRSLFFFYLFITFCFLGWVIYGLQKSPESILIGYRILYAALALLPASWYWFYSALSNERTGWISWIVTGMSFLLVSAALLGKGPLFFGLPLEPDQIAANILRPQSSLLRPLVQSFCLASCLFYFSLIIAKLCRFKDQRPLYLLPAGIGLFIWFLGGLHDAFRTIGISIIVKDQVLWFASIWLSIFLTIAIALHFQSLEQAVRDARDVFERFVPPAYLRRIAAQGLRSIRLGEADQQWVTVLSCDVRGFTALSERLSPSGLISLINYFFERITQVVDRRVGVIDKFLGDMILCIFEGRDSAQRAVDCGVDILKVVKSINREGDRPVDQTIEIKIGIHAGPVILGTIGSPKRMDSTVLGLTVNLAKRIEEVTRHLGVEMLISEQVANQLSNGYVHKFRKLGEVSIKGSSTPIGIIEVYDHDTPEVCHLKDQIEPLMSKGIEFLKGGHLETAMLNFKKAQVIFPQDLALHLLITSVQNSLEQGQSIQGSALLDFRSK